MTLPTRTVPSSRYTQTSRVHAGRHMGVSGDQVRGYNLAAALLPAHVPVEETSPPPTTIAVPSL